jgi:hypothetical protein
MAPVGQMAMQCPQAIQPKTEVSSAGTALPFSIAMVLSEQTSTQSPQPLHFSASMVMRAFSLVLEVGMGIIVKYYAIKLDIFLPLRHLGHLVTLRLAKLLSEPKCSLWLERQNNH